MEKVFLQTIDRERDLIVNFIARTPGSRRRLANERFSFSQTAADIQEQSSSSYQWPIVVKMIGEPTHKSKHVSTKSAENNKRTGKRFLIGQRGQKINQVTPGQEHANDQRTDTPGD